MSVEGLKVALQPPVTSEDSSTCTACLDSEHPASAGRWSPAKKVGVVVTGLLLNTITTLSSSLPSGAIDSLSSAFNVRSHQQASLPVAVFLVGYIFGPLAFGPISESYGRRICFLSSFAIYTIFTFACALAPNWPALLVFRLFVGVGASAPLAVLGGMFSDLYPDLRPRGTAVMILTLTSTFGPIAGPIIAGFSTTTQWQWMFWVNLIIAGIFWPLLLILPETFLPVVLRQRIVEKSSLEQIRPGAILAKPRRKTAQDWIQGVLARPFRMFAEPLVLLTDLILVYQWSILFLYFEAYPIIFIGTYGMSPGEAACMLIPIGVGTVIALAMFLWYDHFLLKSKAQGRDWAQREEYRRLPLACAGGPLYALSLFWLGWTAKSDIHWTVPALSGIPYGMGLDLTFMALMNYLTDAYDIYSASAIASSVLSRNAVAAVVLPLATRPLYDGLGIGWACSLLGFVCLALTPIPFYFIRYGPILRSKSGFCQALKQQEEREKIVAGDIVGANSVVAPSTLASIMTVQPTVSV